MSVQLAMYKGAGSIFSAGVRGMKDSQYSHVELLIGGKCYSSMLREGVRGKAIALPPAEWDLYRLPWADPVSILEWFRVHDGEQYGISDLILCQFFGFRRDGRGAFCSEACAAALGLPNPTSYSPQTLLDQCLFINRSVVFLCHT